MCRRDDEYFLVTSTFAYFPGIPVHRSRDLLAWELVGHVLEADDRRLDGLDVSDGVWAPTIRYHQGMFYVVWAEARGRRWSMSYVSTAAEPAGPWSSPVRIDAEGIDPSLFFDDDGRCWYTAACDAADPERTGPGELWIQEFDHRSLTLVGPRHILWHGAVHGAWVEAPHIYKHAGRYHLVAAEGGTERNHAVTAAQADVVTGPYRTDPRSPLLTHRHLSEDAPVQNVGHADVVDTPDGGIAALVLAVRPVGGHHVLGREVFLVPAMWGARGLQLAPGTGRVEGRLASPAPDPADWMSLRGPIGWEQRPDGILVDPREDDLGSGGRPGMLGRRQSHHRFGFGAETEMPESVGQRVGVVAMQHQDRWVRAAVVREDDGGWAAEIVLRTVAGEETIARASVTGEVTVFRINSDAASYRFTILCRGEEIVSAALPLRTLSTEDAGGFVGVVLGLTHQGDPRSPAALFREVHYLPTGADLSPVSAAAEPADGRPVLRRRTSSVGSR